jgi:urease accessory protein
MRRAVTHFPAGTWPRPQAMDTVTLDFDARHRRRTLLRTDAGEEVLLDLERAVAMADGDGLELEDGSWIVVGAALERVVEISCASLAELVRVAWHLGNRHIPTQLTGQALRIRPDAVLERMVRDLGAQTRFADRPFQPESGAYAGQRSHAHHHAHDHGHDHDHDHDHGHGHHHHHHDRAHHDH